MTTSQDISAGAGPGGKPVVLVIGCGPVGQTAALLLARWGLDVVVLDERAARDLVGSKAIVQQRDVLDVWESVGAGAQIAAEGVTWRTARTFYRDAELFATDHTEAGRSPFPPFVNISQTRTEEILDARIAAAPAIDVRWGHRLTGLHQDTGGVTVRCATPERPEGGVAVRADFVVVCTGARGQQVRDVLGVTFDGNSFADQFLICDIRADLPGWETERRFYFDPEWNPGRQVLVHPCPGSTFRIDWQVPPDFDLTAEEACGALDRRIRQIVGDRDYEIIWRSVYRFHSRMVDRMRLGRVLIAGDAAHLVSPFGARGLNSGVQDAENAAWKIAFVAHGWAGEELLESYHAERLAAAAENLDVTSATMRFLVPRDDAERAWRRSVLDRAVDDPAARLQVDAGRFTEPFWYVDSPLTTPDPARPFTGRPPKGQVPPCGPGVLAPDAPVAVPGRPEIARFRQLAREGFTVLVADGGDAAALSSVLRGVGTAPVQTFALPEIDTTGALTAALAAKPAEVWLIRPDAHVAAVLTTDQPDQPDQLGTAIRRALVLPA